MNSTKQSKFAKAVGHQATEVGVATDVKKRERSEGVK
jgi:hypothetical protein